MLDNLFKENTISEGSQEASSAFGCCSKYRECSDVGKCLIAHQEYSNSCQYRNNLEKGNIFYGKSANGFSQEEYETLLQQVQKLSTEAKEIFDSIIIDCFEYNRGSSSCIIRNHSIDELSAISLFAISTMRKDFMGFCSYQQIKKHIEKNEVLRERYVAVKYANKKIPQKITFHQSEEKFVESVNEHDPEFFEILASPYRLIRFKTGKSRYGEEYYNDYLFGKCENHVYSLPVLAEDELLMPETTKEEIAKLERRNSLKKHHQSGLDSQKEA